MVRANESGAKTTGERKKCGTKERRHRPRRRELGKTGGRLPDGGSEGEAGKKVDLDTTVATFPQLAPRAQPSVSLGEMKGKAKASVVHSDPR